MKGIREETIVTYVTIPWNSAITTEENQDVIVGVSAETRTWYFQNINQTCLADTNVTRIVYELLNKVDVCPA